MRNLVLPNNPILRKKAEYVTKELSKTKVLNTTLKKMYRVSFGRRKNANKPLLVGLAAPQVGIPLRIIFVDTGANGKGSLSNLEVFLNPEIIYESRETSDWYEGCWSTSKVCGIVTRCNAIRVKALDLNLKKIEREYTGYVARIFQHEIDHLNGILFPDRISNPRHLHLVEEEEFTEYRNKQAWKEWKKLCEIDQWKKIST